MSWEMSVIGTVLADPSTMQAAESLTPSDFTGPNQIVWGEIMALYNQGALDVRALVNRLHCSPDWERVSDTGTEPYIQNCLTYRGQAIETYVDEVMNEAVRRAIRRNAALIAAEAEGNRRTADDLLDFAEQKILSLRRNRSDEGVSLGDLMGVFVPRLEGIRTGDVVPGWVPKIQALRDRIVYFDQTDYITIAARPGEGKSSALRYEAYMGAKDPEHPTGIVIYNLENDNNEYAKFMVSMHTGIDSDLLKNPRLLSQEQLEKVKEAASQLSRLPIFIVQAAGWNVQHIVRSARRYIAEKRVSLVMVDYVQLIRNGEDNRVQDISISTGALRALALNQNVPVIQAAQLNRSIETRNREDAEPRLADLRDSGSLEQDSSVVIFSRQEKTTQEDLAQFPENVDQRTRRVLPEIKAVPIKYYIAKNRNGPIGVSGVVKWIKSTNTFQSLAPQVFQRGA